jgi:hypothetical protein
MVYVLFCLLGYFIFSVDFVTSWRTADVRDALKVSLRIDVSLGII